MSRGLRYETGRDMPPGMIEKAAVKIARNMEQGATTPQSACAADSECCGMPATGRHEDNGFAARSATPDKGSLQGERIATPAEQARNDKKRKKLIELLEGAKNCREIFCTARLYCSELTADYLIANGVEIRECVADCKNCWKTKLVNAPNRWIPVTERLPEQSGEYIGWIVDTSQAASLWYNSVEDVWFNDDYRDAYSVSHWMSLPEPPEVEK